MKKMKPRSILLRVVSIGIIAAVIIGASILPSAEILDVETQRPSIILPESLTKIEDEAFDGALLENVVLPESLVEIGNRAFANMPVLQYVFIPDGVKIIGEDILEDSDHVRVGAPLGSCARRWAIAHGYPVLPELAYYAGNPSMVPETHGMWAANDTDIKIEYSYGWALAKGKLNLIVLRRSKRCAALNVQDRCFP